jgi:phosphatidylglycerol:prolipoprotein diacylglycerol transferase
MLLGIGVSLWLWSRLAKRDDRLPLVYLGGLCGAFLGAKLVYLLAEGWLHYGREDFWRQLATGKTIVGALLGGYAGVELGKRFVGYHAVTGDWFALIAPVGIIVGRLGCLLHGCCPGNECPPAWYALTDHAGATRWPAVPVEIAFNALFALGLVVVLRPRRLLRGQHFHLYLIAYGLFRFAHESVRATPKVFGPMSGYQVAALALVILGVARFWQRRQSAGQALVPPPTKP